MQIPGLDLNFLIKKDILNLVYLSEYFGLPEVSEFWEGVVKFNYWHQDSISKLVVKKLFGTVSGKKISILGFAFKANTNDTRESASIKICKDLLEEGANLSIHDPKVDSDQIAKDLKMKEKKSLKRNDLIKENSQEGSWSFSSDIYDSVNNADAVLVLTEWEDYTNINWEKVSKIMRKPSWIFDARSIIEPSKVIKTGLNFWRIGDGLN